MARPLPSNILRSKGTLEIAGPDKGVYRAYYTPPADAMPAYGAKVEDFKKPIFDIDTTNHILRFVPFKVYGIYPLERKYLILGMITIELQHYLSAYIPNKEDIDDYLPQMMPGGFMEDYNYGLGFKKIYNEVVKMLESFGIENLYIPLKGKTEIDIAGKKAIIPGADLAQLIKKIDYINGRAQRAAASLKRKAIIDDFGTLLNGSTRKQENKELNHKLASMMEKVSGLASGQATVKEQNELIQTVRKNGARIATDQPGELVKLRNDIELITMGQLIARFEDMLDKNLSEARWQQFFEANPLVLNMVFNFPVIKIREQAVIGGRTFSGAGDKVTDFLFKNAVTNNVAVIEIKKPSAALLSARAYRGDVFSPSNELTAGINQALDQVFRLQSEMGQLKLNARRLDLEAFFITGILIIGNLPKGIQQQKSFELFRGNSKSIFILTFDELLAKLKTLYELLGGTFKTQDKAQFPQQNDHVDEDLPF